MEWTLEAFEPRHTVWDNLKNRCEVGELDAVKTLLGYSLVEEIEELQREIQMLLDIWRDCRKDTEHCHGSSADSRLPEPPSVRENLTKQIKLFVKLLKDKSERDITRKLSKSQSAVVEYVLKDDCNNTSYQRPLSSRSSQDGHETPMRATPVDRLSRPSSVLTDYGEILDEETMVLKIEELATQLRGDLVQDKAALESDISFLQGCLMEENDYQTRLKSSLLREPTLKELQDVGIALEREVLKKDSVREKKPSNTKSKSSRDDHLEGIKMPNASVQHRHPRPLARHSSTKQHEQGDATKQPDTEKKSYPVKVMLIPSPPSTAKPGDLRQTSTGAAASRFRRMVLECRNSDP